MYKFLCSGITNNGAIKEITKKSDDIQQIRKKASMDKISYIIFNEPDSIDEKLYKILTISLSLGDSLDLPIHNKIANILFFALCVNMDEKIGIKIRNLSQANTLYELYDNDYESIKIETNENSELDFAELKLNHHNFMDNYFVIWKIPIRFFKYKGHVKVTPYDSDNCILTINDKEHKIPRIVFMKFFEKSLKNKKLTCDSVEELKEKFDMNDDNLDMVLSYIGFERKRELSDIDISQYEYNMEDNKLFCTIQRNSNTLDSNYWTHLSYYKYILLPNVDYIVFKDQETLSVLINL